MKTTEMRDDQISVSLMYGHGFLRAKLIHPDGRVQQIGSSAADDAYEEMRQRVLQWAADNGYSAEIFAGSGTLTKNPVAED